VSYRSIEIAAASRNVRAVETRLKGFKEVLLETILGRHRGTRAKTSIGMKRIVCRLCHKQWWSNAGKVEQPWATRVEIGLEPRIVAIC
jgi:hypothetical protein